MGKRQRSVLGQNFLTDWGARQRVAAALGEAGRGDVVEIGPGKAAITDLLAEQARRLLAIEVDPALAAALRTRFSGISSVEIVEADVLTVNFATLARVEGRSLAVVGNLPYYITSPILQRLFLFEERISRAVVMVQREVAERITASPGSRDYGLLTVLCQVHARCELLFTLPPEAFQPPPEVESAVVCMHFAPRWAELEVAQEPFRRFLQSCFAQKRKTLANNLRAAGWDTSIVAGALASAEQAEKVRAEELSPDALARVFRVLA